MYEKRKFKQEIVHTRLLWWTMTCTVWTLTSWIDTVSTKPWTDCSNDGYFLYCTEIGNEVTTVTLNWTDERLPNWLIELVKLTWSGVFCLRIRNTLAAMFWNTFSGGFLGLNKLIFFVNYFCLQNKLFILMAMFLIYSW